MVEKAWVWAFSLTFAGISSCSARRGPPLLTSPVLYSCARGRVYELRYFCVLIGRLVVFYHMQGPASPAVTPVWFLVSRVGTGKAAALRSVQANATNAYAEPACGGRAGELGLDARSALARSDAEIDQVGWLVHVWLPQPLDGVGAASPWYRGPVKRASGPAALRVALP
jgi:hypothetical protein